MLALSREDLRSKLLEFASGALTLESLRRWFTPFLVADELAVVDRDQALVYRLLFLLEDDSIDEHRHRRNARRIGSALTQISLSSDVLRILPLILDQERVVEIVRKHQQGVISRTGFLSMITEARYPAELKRLLAHTGGQRLTVLRELLVSERYREVAQFLDVGRDHQGGD